MDVVVKRLDRVFFPFVVAQEVEPFREEVVDGNGL